MIDPDARQALTDALLMEFGFGETVSMPLSEARDRMSPRTRAVLETLEEDGYTITRINENTHDLGHTQDQ
jgi:hypothetical protein